MKRKLLNVGLLQFVKGSLQQLMSIVGVNTLLLTVLGFVVGLSLSFRSSTAYERYSEGRKAWCTLLIHSRNLARYVWIHVSLTLSGIPYDLVSDIAIGFRARGFA